MSARTPHLTAKLQGFGTTIFAEMSQLAVATNSGGRATYRNIGRTRRQGIEASLDSRLAADWRLQLAYTWLDARVREAYVACSGTPCTSANTEVEAGLKIPGAPRNSAYAGLSWGQGRGWNAAFDARYVGRVAVNDLNSESAPSYRLLGADAGYRVEWTR